MSETQFFYTGGVVKAEPVVPAPNEATGQDESYQNPAADTLPAAEQMLAEVQQRAEEFRQARFAEIEQDYEEQLASRILSSLRDLNIELNDIAGDLVAILGVALHEITGERKDPQTLIATIKRNIRRYQRAKSLIVHVGPKDFNHIEAAWAQARTQPGLEHVSLVLDESLNEGRCLLAVDKRRFEIGIDAQLKAFESEATKLLQTSLHQASA